MENIKSKISNYIPYIGLATILIFFVLVTGADLFSSRNIQALVNEAFMIIISSCALIFVMSQGEIDLSSGATVALSAGVGAYVSYISPLLAILICVVVGVIIGLLNGLIVAKLRVASFIATIAMMFLLKGITSQLLAEGGKRIPFQMLKWNSMGLRVITLVAILMLGFIVFEYTKLGKQCKAIGSNSVVARYSGINVDLIKISGFVIVGAIAGLMAFYSIIRTGTAATSTGLNYEFNAMIALLLGGMPITGGSSSKYRCAIIGGISMAILSNGMSVWGIDLDIQQLVRGIIFIIVITLTFDRENIAVIK